ncbi:hypothetical protein HBI83_231860 [Parastagonospora nodorum]|nr:hypothetical protein HBI83_231860 [Parastagonospora nodorum]
MAETATYVNPQTCRTGILWLAGFVQFGFGLPFYEKAIAAMRNTGLLYLPMDALIAASTTTSYIMGLKSYFLGKDVHYATTAATLIFVISLGRYVGEMFRTSSAPTIAAFSNIVPSEARLLRSPTPVSSHTLKPGDFVVVEAAHRFPCDGRLVAYPNQFQTLNLNIDESIHTGESILVKKVWGDICLAGTINSHSQEIIIEVIEGGRNRLDQILDAVLEAQLQKSDIQPWLDQVSEYMVSCVMFCAFIAFLVWLPDGFDTAATFFSTTLIVACPCAFGLSVPAMTMIACSLGAAKGVVVRAGVQAFQKSSTVTTIVFDKTGTLTTGDINVVHYKIHGRWEEPVWWQVIGEAEKRSRHWTSTVIAKYIEVHHPRSVSMSLSKSKPQEAPRETPGSGVTADVDEVKVVVGNEQYLRNANVQNLDTLMNDVETLSNTHSCTFVGLNGRYAGFIAFSDPVRDDANKEIRALKSQGYEIYMMTGDRTEVAKEVANAIGIQNVFAELTPVQKSDKIKRLRKEGKVVAMIGDGINDTAALAASDIGISLQSCHSVVLASSDIVLLTSSLRMVSIAFTLARNANAAIKGSIFWAALYNFTLLPLAMGAGARWNIIMTP